MREKAERALAAASAAGADQAEVFAQGSRSLKISVYQGEVEELASSTGSGIGVRAIIGGSTGYAYTTDLGDDGLVEAARDAVENAAVTAGDEFIGLPDPADTFPELELLSAALSGTGLEDKIEIARTIESSALARDERVTKIEASQYVESESSVAIVNSLGFNREHQEGACYAFLQAIAEDKGEMQTGISFTTGREPGQLDSVACGHEAADRALMLLGGSQCSSMTCPVVTDPFVTANLVSVIGSVLSGEAVQKRRSMFAGREGQRVASGAIRLIDDGLHPEGLASSPFDGEGVPCGETVLINDGILQGFLYDTYTARKDGRASTGNAARGSYRSPPHVGTTNLRLLGGDRSAEDIIAMVGDGFYVTEVSGIHSGANPVSGELSVGAAGILISGGKLAEPVREVTIAGNLLAMLTGIEVVGNDNRWVPFGGSIHAPTLLIEEMTISGK
jgi:PmbA protein